MREETSMELIENYKVNLPAFEGPLDLLLYLIRKNDLDIYNIPISFITEEYLRYLDRLKELNMDLAGEFLVMAAELTFIKSRMLLPEKLEEEEGEDIDPRAELARRLAEYQRFKVAAVKLNERPLLGRNLFGRPFVKEQDLSQEGVPLMGEVFQLMNAFSDVLKRLPKDIYHEVVVDRLSLTERIYQLMEYLKRKQTLSLKELLPDPLTRYDVVITFLALLEMARLKMIKVYQQDGFGPLVIRGAMETFREEIWK